MEWDSHQTAPASTWRRPFRGGGGGGRGFVLKIWQTPGKGRGPGFLWAPRGGGAVSAGNSSAPWNPQGGGAPPQAAPASTWRRPFRGGCGGGRSLSPARCGSSGQG